MQETATAKQNAHVEDGLLENFSSSPVLQRYQSAKANNFNNTSVLVFTSHTHCVNKQQGISMTRFKEIMHTTSKSPVLPHKGRSQAPPYRFVFHYV